MVKVYIFAGFMTVFALAGLAWLIIARFGLALFRAKKKEKDVAKEPPEGARWHRPADGGPGYWV